MLQFFSWAKQKGKISFGSPGVGTSPHLSGVLFAKRTGLDAVHVPFRGASYTIPAMLAVTSTKRWPTMPDVPTMAEAGLQDFVVTSWAAFVLPAGTPRPIVDKLSAAMKKIAADPEPQKRFPVVGARSLSSTPEEALAYAAKERALWQDVVALSGIKPRQPEESSRQWERRSAKFICPH